MSSLISLNVRKISWHSYIWTFLHRERCTLQFPNNIYLWLGRWGVRKQNCEKRGTRVITSKYSNGALWIPLWCLWLWSKVVTNQDSREAGRKAIFGVTSRLDSDTRSRICRSNPQPHGCAVTIGTKIGESNEEKCLWTHAQKAKSLGGLI